MFHLKGIVQHYLQRSDNSWTKNFVCNDITIDDSSIYMSISFKKKRFDLETKINGHTIAESVFHSVACLID